MSFHPLTRGLGVALALGLIVASPVLGADPSTRVDTRHICPGAIDVPAHLTIAPPDGGIAPGATVQLQVTITADVPLSNARLTINPEGSVRLLGPPALALGEIQQGSRTMSIPVQFQVPRALSDGRAAVTVKLEASDPGNGMTYKKQDGVFAITRGGQFRAAEGAYITAEINAIRQDLKAGLIAESDADKQTLSAATMTGTWNQSAIPSYSIPPEAQVKMDILGSVRPLPRQPIRPQIGANRITSGSVTFNGNVSWTASDGTVHPAFGTSVTIWEFNALFPLPVPFGSVATGVDGNYSITVPVIPLNFCFVEISTSNTWVQITPTFPLPIPYLTATAPVFDPGNGSVITNNFVAANTGTGPSIGLHSMVTYEAAFTADRNGGPALGFFPIQWPGSSGAAFYDGLHINLRPFDRYAYDVMYHEWGHYVQDSFNMEDGVGGPHNIGDCIAFRHGSKDEGVRMSWSEGWPTYWGTTAQRAYGLPGMGIPTVGDATYTDTEEGNFSYSLEDDSGSFEDGLGRGEDNELAVQRTLWDLVDTNSDNRDAVGYSDQTLVDIWKNTNVKTLSQAWGILRGTLSDAQQLSFGAITTDALIGPGCSGPANNVLVTPTQNLNYSWTKNVGCPTSYSGDVFVLRFFSSSGTPILSIPTGATNSHTLTAGEFVSLASAGHHLRWAVEGSNTQSPATGPFLGENRAIVLDRAPIARAGLDRLNIQCASHTTTPVQLDGTASNDPDGDALTYTWTAPGVSFDNSHASMPIGYFPEGTTSVTLTVSDGTLTDQDQVTVGVIDTTAPTITCPPDLTVECDLHCGPSGGVLSSDALVAAFLNGATASDICDPNPTAAAVSPPACFGLGTTLVTFRATDADGNHTECTAYVHVVDGTAPAVSVVLAPKVLWPPDNKLVDIHAFVTATDSCDSHPGVVLTAITRNCLKKHEAQEDIKKPDIVGATYGAPDFDFQLRAEKCGSIDDAVEDSCSAACTVECAACDSIADLKARKKCHDRCAKDCKEMCKHPDRIYTVYYTATDGSGNSSTGSAEVHVPHDKKGLAMLAAGSGMGPNGFEGTELKVVIPTQLQDPATVTDGGGNETDIILGSPRPAPNVFFFDAAIVDTRQIFLGNSQLTLQPTGTRLVDMNGDGIEDLVVTYAAGPTQRLMTLPVVLDDPITLYYRTYNGDGYEVEGMFGTGDQLAATAMRPGRGLGAPEHQAGSVLDGAAVADAPSKTELSGVYPNPAHGEATVAFSLSHEQSVDLAVYDVRGARVRTLRTGTMGPGRYTMSWDGRNDSGRPLTGGMFFVRFTAGRYGRTIKTAMMP
jgi:hypothetical protein